MFDLTLTFDNGPDRDTTSGVLNLLAREGGAQFRQDFPPDCVPLLRGKPVLALDPFVSKPG